MNLNESSFAVNNKVSVSINYENCLMQLFRDASFDMMIYNDCDDLHIFIVYRYTGMRLIVVIMEQSFLRI